MKIINYNGCLHHSVRFTDLEPENILPEINLKRLAISKIIENVNDEEELDGILKDILWYMKPIYGEYDRCGQCGDNNIYEEFEI